MTVEVRGRLWQRYVHGAAGLEEGRRGGMVPHRLPAWARDQAADPSLGWIESCATGVVLRFDSLGAPALLEASATVVTGPGAEPASACLVVRQGDHREEIPLTQTAGRRRDRPAVGSLSVRPYAPRTVEIPVWESGPVDVLLPHNARVELLSLRAEHLETARRDGRRWTHYGSSISHGLNAPAPDRTWPAQAAATLGWRLRDLSLAGNAQLDGFAARVIRDAAADLITLKVGVNTVGADSLRERTFRPALHAFLDTIREGQPDTPIVLITALACPMLEATPGPTYFDGDGIAHTAARSVDPDEGALTLSRTREIVAEVAAVRADPHLRCIDGLGLFGPCDAGLLVDSLHPSPQGLDLIARRFVEQVPAVLDDDGGSVRP